MPIYEYECGSCSTVHEVSQKFSDAPMGICPSCGGPVRKLISLSSFVLKGSGFYTTDYKRAGMKPAETSPPSCASTGGPCGKPECATG